MSTVAEIEAGGTLSFHQALLQAEAQARSTLDVALHERLSAAVALVKAGRVFQTSAGDWQVDSSSTAGLTYTVNGTCTCEDHHYNHPPQGLCKHRIGMFLAQRVLTLMRQPPQPVVPELVEPWPDNDPENVAPAVEPEPAPASPAVPPAPLPEAPASVNVRLTIDGRDCQLTLRGVSEEDVLLRLERILVRYPVAASSSTDTAIPQCASHGAMRKSTKGKGWYCPGKNPDGSWCNAKPTPRR